MNKLNNACKTVQFLAHNKLQYNLEINKTGTEIRILEFQS